MGAQPRRGPCGVTTGTGTQQQHLPQVAVQHGGARVGGVLSPDTLGKPPGASGNLRGSALGLRDDLGLESTTRRHRVSPAQPPQTSNRSAQLNMTPEDRHTFWRAGGSTGSPVAGPPPRPPAAKHVFPAARPQFLAGARHFFPHFSAENAPPRTGRSQLATSAPCTGGQGLQDVTKMGLQGSPLGLHPCFGVLRVFGSH